MNTVKIMFHSLAVAELVKAAWLSVVCFLSSSAEGCRSIMLCISLLVHCVTDIANAEYCAAHFRESSHAKWYRG